MTEFKPEVVGFPSVKDSTYRVVQLYLDDDVPCMKIGYSSHGEVLQDYLTKKGLEFDTAEGAFSKRTFPVTTGPRFKVCGMSLVTYLSVSDEMEWGGDSQDYPEQAINPKHLNEILGLGFLAGDWDHKILFKPEVDGEISRGRNKKVVQFYIGPEKDVPITLIGGLTHASILMMYFFQNEIDFDFIYGKTSKGHVPALEGELYRVAGMGRVSQKRHDGEEVYLWFDRSGDYGLGIDEDHVKAQLAAGLLPDDLEHRIEAPIK